MAGGKLKKPNGKKFGRLNYENKNISKNDKCHACWLIANEWIVFD